MGRICAHHRLRARWREPDHAAGYINVLPGAVEDLVLAPACRQARAQTVVGPQVPDEGSAARTG